MSTDPPTDSRKDVDGEDLERDVRDAVASLGWVVPQSEDEVLRAEAELAADAALAGLPEPLRDAKSVFDRASQETRTTPQTLQIFGGREIEGDLARAAREGGRIPPEIEERMRRDRQAAERELDDDEDAP